MIPAGVQVFVALEPVELRDGFERLSGWVRERVGDEARSGALFVFVSKRRASLNIIFFDGSGNCAFSKKKLDRGTFALPEAPADGAAHVGVDEATFDALLDGFAIAPASPTVRPPRRLHEKPSRPGATRSTRPARAW